VCTRPPIDSHASQSRRLSVVSVDAPLLRCQLESDGDPLRIPLVAAAAVAGIVLTGGRTISAPAPVGVPYFTRVSTTTSHGIRLTLQVPKIVQPKNGIVRVKVTVKNLGRDPIYMNNSYPYMGCFTHAPIAYVTNARGAMVDWLPPGGPIPSCPADIVPPTSCSQETPDVSWPLIQPARSLSAYYNLVLVTSHVRARIDNATVLQPCSRSKRYRAVGHVYYLSTRLSFSLRPAKPLIAQLSGSPPDRVTVVRPAGAHGPMWANGWISCRGDRERAWSAEFGVPTTIHGNTDHLDTSGCDPRNMRVEMALGWSGYPAAFVHYQRGKV